MRYRNSFTVKRKSGETHTAFNRMTGIADALRTGLPMTGYIALYSGDTVIASYSAAVEEYNADPTSGALFVTRSVVVMGADLGGRAITAFAFCEGAGAAHPINRAETQPLLLSADESAVVSGTLYFTPEDGGAAFTAGDNPLIRVFLGLDALDLAAFTLCAGQNLCGGAPSARGLGFLSEPVPAAVSLDADGLCLSGTSTEPYYEAVLLYGGVPVMRGVPAPKSRISAYSGRINADGFADLGALVLTATAFRSGGAAVSDYSLFPQSGGMTTDCPPLIRQKLYKNTKLFADPYGAYALCLSDRTIVLMGFAADGGLCERARAQIQVKTARVTAEGRVYAVLCSGEGVCLTFVNGAFDCTPEPYLNGCDAFEALSLGADTLFAVRRGSSVIVARLGGDGTAHTLQTVSGAGVEPFVFSPEILGVRTGNTAVFVKAAGEVPLFSTRFSEFAARGYEPESMGMYGVMTAVREGCRVVCDFFTGNVRAVPDGGTAVLFGAGALILGGDTAVFYSPKSDETFPADGVGSGTAAVRLGKYALFVAPDGKCQTMYFIEHRQGVLFHYLSNANLTATLALRRSPAAATGSNRAVFKTEF